MAKNEEVLNVLESLQTALSKLKEVEEDLAKAGNDLVAAIRSDPDGGAPDLESSTGGGQIGNLDLPL